MSEGPEHLDVLVLGAGLSGVAAGHYLQTACPWARYAIFEARAAIGGTWDLFRYPGIRSDSDMFTLGYGFRPWERDQAIADGGSILAYIRQTAADEGIDGHVRFGHRAVRAVWSSDEARWTVTAELVGTGDSVTVTCDFLFSCTGYYRYDHGYQPDFPGLERYGGTVVHPQAWPEDLDVAGRRVVVIGSGATAVTLVPALAAAGADVTMLQRSPSYIMSLPLQDPLAPLVRRVLPRSWAGAFMKWSKALLAQGFYVLCRRRPALAKRILRRALVRQLPPGYDVDAHFSPRYDPWDQRLCLVPDGDLFAAIRAGTVTVVTDRIATFTESGLALESGRRLEADVVVSATGLELLFLGGLEVVIDGETLDLPEKLAYKGMMLEDVPNFAMAVGYTNASWTLKCELTCQTVCRLLNHMRARGLRRCTPVNHDPSVAALPLLSLTSGYIERAADRFPKQGSKLPWRVHQSYLRDYRALKLSPIEDPALEFDGAPERVATPA